MHGLNKEFMADPPAFMRKYPLDMVDRSLTLGEPGQKKAGVYNLDLSHGGSDKGRVIVGLFGVARKHSHPIEAHWLPWTSGGTSELTLDKRAKFFFTAALAGCRIQIAGTKVLHIAGDTKLVKVTENTTSRGKKIIHVETDKLKKEDPEADQEAGVAWRTLQAKERAGAQFDPARKFSSSDYKLDGYGFLVGYATHGVWLFVGQTLQEEDGKLFVRSCTELVGGEFTA